MQGNQLLTRSVLGYQRGVERNMHYTDQSMSVGGLGSVTEAYTRKRPFRF